MFPWQRRLIWPQEIAVLWDFVSEVLEQDRAGPSISPSLLVAQGHSGTWATTEGKDSHPHSAAVASLHVSTRAAELLWAMSADGGEACHAGRHWEERQVENGLTREDGECSNPNIPYQGFSSIEFRMVHKGHPDNHPRFFSNRRTEAQGTEITRLRSLRNKSAPFSTPVSHQLTQPLSITPEPWGTWRSFPVWQHLAMCPASCSQWKSLSVTSFAVEGEGVDQPKGEMVPKNKMNFSLVSAHRVSLPG